MADFTDILMLWYAEHKRSLPWRETTDPYRIWISEIILQQTRVVQGFAYYQRFVERFPDVEALASAPLDEVLKYWQGLGYYSRARNLHEAARSMNGCFPRTYSEVRALKGVGDYTAAAVCSIAYGLPHAVVDGNVYRVLSRYYGLDTPIDTGAGKKQFAALAQQLLPADDVGVYNQAIMDFGAIQCTPLNPDCMFCPLADSCSALSSGRVDELPVKQGKVKVRTRYFTYLYVRAGTTVFLHKRAGRDIWQGLYELPLIETDAPFAGMEQLVRHPLWQEWMQGTCVPLDVRLVCRQVKHVLSHQVLYADLYEVVLSPQCTAFASFMPVSLDDLKAYAFPRLLISLLGHAGVSADDM